MNDKSINLDNIDYFLINYNWLRIVKYAVYEKDDFELVFDVTDYVEIYDKKTKKRICETRFQTAKDLFYFFHKNGLM